MKSLYSRVLLITLAVILASSVLGFLASNIYYHVKLKPYNDEKLVGMAEEMKRFVESHPAETESYLANAASLGYTVYMTDGQGDSRVYGKGFRRMDLAERDLVRVLGGDVYHGVAQFPNKPFITGFFENSLSNTIGVPVALSAKRYALFMRPDVLVQFGELRIFFALIGSLTVLISILLFLLSTRYLVKPITRLTKATKTIAQGHFNVLLPTGRRDEIGQLAAHFMSMSRELERIDRARRQFVSDVSHEIQSPLTSIQGFANAMAQRELPPEERERYAAIIEQESRHLSKLSKQLLTLSSLEQGEESLSKKEIPLQEHIRQAVQVLQWKLDEKELLLKLSVPASATVYGDEVLLMQVWMNLLDNAVNHIPPGRSIEIRAERTPTQTIVVVADTGEGIAAEHLPFLFDRFYRVDRARERASGRTGLGLAIVKRIVRMHGGSIEAVSAPGEGTSFTVAIPHL